MNRFRWRNLPLPEGHVISLVLGVVLHTRLPLTLFKTRWLSQVLGWPLLVLGSLLAAWAVVTVKDINLSRPTQLIDAGPYRFSRNPMYLAWTVMYVGVTAIVNTCWLLLLLPVLIAFTHYGVVLREEKQLEQVFGEAYRQYCARVRRYWLY